MTEDTHLRLMQARYVEICPPLYKQTDPGHSGLNSKSFQKVLSWQVSPRGMLITGDTGKGKTRAVWCLINDLLCKKGIPCRAVSDPSFSREYSEKLGNGTANDWMSKLCRVRVLFIDDLGKASVTNRYKEQLYDVLEKRMCGLLPTIITTQWNSKRLLEIYGQEDGRAILRRLLDTCETIAF